jgi:hypothetical protein
VFDDPRARFVIEDARAELAAAGTRYDLIMSEPSNPWVSGVSGLFTTEFYDLIARHLTDDGVFGQWLHLYEMTDELVLSVVAALDRTFPSYTLYHTEALDVLVVASRRPTLPVPDWSVTRQPAIAADLAMFHPLSAETLDALRLADHDALAPLVADGIRANSDFWPVLDLGAERARYLGGRAQGFAALTAPRFDPFAALAGRRTPLPRDPLTAVPSIPPARAAALSARLRAAPDGRDTLPADRAFSAAAMRRATLEAWLARRVAPPDWQGWISQVVLVEHDLHGRAQGVADERFYAALRRYLAATRPPLQAVAAVEFMHGLAAWAFAEAARSADRLSFDASLGEGWVPATMLLDGGVVAKLRTGDVAGARALYDELTPHDQ